MVWVWPCMFLDCRNGKRDKLNRWIDGLASGITLFGLLAVSVVGYLGGISSVIWMSSLLIGCLLGFLVYNSRPASIFLGDCGSLTLGYLAGCLTLLASFREGGVLDGIFPVLAFAVPITDCFFAIFRRMMRGRSPFSQIWSIFTIV